MKKLIRLANVLDLSGQYSIANKVDEVIINASKINPISKSTMEFDLKKNDPKEGKVKIKCKDKEKFSDVLDQALDSISKKQDEVIQEENKDVNLEDLFKQYFRD